MKTIVTTLVIALVLGMNIGLTTADDLPPSTTKGDLMVLANQIGTQYAVSLPLMKAVVTCESSFNPIATHISKREQSYGLSQINRLAHPGVSIQQAEDPTYALTYLASGLKSNPQAWSCYSKIKGVK